MNDSQKLDMLLEAMAGLTQKVTAMETELKEVKNTVTKIENVHGDKLGIIFDKLKQHDDQLERIESKVDDLSEKVDKHDIKIQVIEGGKYKAN